MYGPSNDNKLFWDKVVDNVLFYHTNLIVVEDLNFTTNDGKIWGLAASLDPLAGYFGSLLQEHHLVEFLPNNIVPTWRNGHLGLKAISKTLDQFLLTEDLAL